MNILHRLLAGLAFTGDQQRCVHVLTCLPVDEHEYHEGDRETYEILHNTQIVGHDEDDQRIYRQHDGDGVRPKDRVVEAFRILLTTEAAVVDIPEEKSATPDMSAMAGMGGMGMM